MTTTLWIALAGILVTGAFGIWGAYQTVKQNRYPAAITFIKEEFIPLFDTIVKSLPSLDVLYNNNLVDENLVLVRASFINTGKKDISADMIETPLTLTLGEGGKWIEAEVTSASENTTAEIKVIDDHKIQVLSGLLRRDEYIRFQALVEVSADEKDSKIAKKGLIEQFVEENLEITHRIQDTQKVGKIELKPDAALSKKFRRFLVFPVAGVVLLIAVIVATLVKGFPGQLTYNMTVGQQDTVSVRIKGIRINEIDVAGINSKFKATLSKEEFFAQDMQLTGIALDKSDLFIVLFTSLTYIIIPSIYAAVSYRKIIYHRRLRRLIGKD